MDSVELMDSFADFKEFKNIDRPTMMQILEEVFRGMLTKKYGDDENFYVIINPEKGDLEVWWNRDIVPDGEVENEGTQVSYSDAIKIEPDFEIGEELSEEVKLEDFGRRAVLSMRQNLISKIHELEKDNVYRKYKDRVGEIGRAHV